jgi:hypothetical protein
VSKHVDVQAASQDLRFRTLSRIPQPLDRLIYLASTRDYNTGLYHHDGLALRFSQEAACEALADSHREAFRQLLTSSLEEIVNQLQAYMEASRIDPMEFIRIALAISENRSQVIPPGAPGALQPRSPVR